MPSTMNGMRRVFGRTIERRVLVPLATVALLWTTGCGNTSPTVQHTDKSGSRGSHSPVTIATGNRHSGMGEHALGNKAEVRGSNVRSNQSNRNGVSDPSGGPHRDKSSVETVHLPEGTPSTVASVASPYIGELIQLKTTYLSQANALYDQAVQQHRAHVENDRALYNEYYQKGMVLEANAQGRANQILFGLRDELRRKHLSTQIVDDLRNQYYAQVQREVSTMATTTSKSVLGL